MVNTTIQQELTEASERLRQATLQQARKAPAFESDPLFVYLWDRAWGTSEYRGRGLIRVLDGWVAHLSGYRQARSTFWMLNEIPRRLQERVTKLQRKLDTPEPN